MSTRWRIALVLALTLLLPVAAAVFKVWIYQDAIQLGYRLSEREGVRRSLRNEVRQLEIEVSAERSPARLLESAKALGLVPPQPHQVWTYHEQSETSRPATNTGLPKGGP